MPQGGYITLADSSSVYLRSRNSTREQTVLLLHGWLHSSARWKSLMEQLEDYCVIAPDLPGFGKSPINIRNHSSIADFVEVLGMIINVIETNDRIYAVIGHSLGGLISLLYLQKQPNYTNNFFLCGVPIRINFNLRLSAATSRMLHYGLLLARFLPLKIVSFFVRIGSSPTVKHFKSIDDILIHDVLAANPRTSSTLLRNIPDISAEITNLPAYPAKSIVLSRGKYDRFTERVPTLTLCDQLGAEYLEFAHSGHVPQLEEPNIFNKSVMDFLASASIEH